MRVARSTRGRVLFAIALACIALVSPLAAPQARAQATKPPASTPSDYYCPSCHAPVRWDMEKCPVCGAEFEPLKPRVLKGQAPAEPVAASPSADRNESPFQAPPPGAAYAKPQTQIIDSPWPQVQPPAASRFGLASYGRVGVLLGGDLSGAKRVNVVDFQPRLDETPYEELHFFYKDTIGDLPILVKTTLFSSQRIFHYSGETDAQIGLRELYAEISPLPSLALWIGARMYRGDQIYILDFWPLDNQNTLGGGVAWKIDDAQTLQAHVGFNRIIDGNSFYQFQEIDVPVPNGVGTQKEIFLDRNRAVGSMTYKVMAPYGLKFKAHGELHYLPPGSRQLSNGTPQHMPAEFGTLVGGEVEENFDPSFVRLFMRYSKGIGAYDPLSIPYGFDTNLSIAASWKALVGLGGAIDTHTFGMHYGAYWQRFQDSSGIDNHNDQDQFAMAVWPEVYLGDHFRLGMQLSWQGLKPKGLYSETGTTLFPQVTELTFLAGAATGRGPFARPALYVLGGWRWLNDGARVELARSQTTTPSAREAIFGLLAEWWF